MSGKNYYQKKRYSCLAGHVFLAGSNYNLKKLRPKKQRCSRLAGGWKPCFLAGSNYNWKNYNQKKRYSWLVDSWNKSQITICHVKIWTPIITNWKKLRPEKKKVVIGWSTKQNTQHTHTQQPTRWAVPPYPPAALPPLTPWVEQWRHQIMAPPLPNAMRRPWAIGVALAVVGLLAWGGEIRGIE
jgi:hypothetical protein